MNKLLIGLCFLLVGCATVQFVDVRPGIDDKNVFTDNTTGLKFQIDPGLKFKEYFAYDEYQTYSEGGTAIKSGDTWKADVFLFGTADKSFFIVRKKAGDGNYWFGIKTHQIKNLIKQTSSDGFENFLNYNSFPISRKLFDAISTRMAFKTSSDGLIYTRDMVSWKDKKIEYNLIYSETVDNSFGKFDSKLMTQAQAEAIKLFEERAINAVKIIQN